MSAFTIVNTTNQPGLVVINKGPPGGPNNLFGRIAVAANGQTIVPTTEAYTAVAYITMEDGNTYQSSVVSLPNGTQSLTAQMLVANGTFNFQVLNAPGSVLDQITLTNTCRQPVTFTITATPITPNGQPVLTSAVVVNQLDTVPVSTAETYGFQSNVNGITTEAITTSPSQTGQNVNVTIYQDTSNFGDWPSYNLSFA